MDSIFKKFLWKKFHMSTAKKKLPDTVAIFHDCTFFTIYEQILPQKSLENWFHSENKIQFGNQKSIRFTDILNFFNFFQNSSLFLNGAVHTLILPEIVSSRIIHN